MKGLSLSQKLIAAVRENAAHEIELNAFSQSIPEPTRVQWLSMVTDWEADPTKSNPYDIAAECKFFLRAFSCPLLMCVCGVKTQASVRLELIQMETTAPSGHMSEKMSATSFLEAAFDIEDTQCVPSWPCRLSNQVVLPLHRYILQKKAAALDDDSTATQRAHVQESQLVLRNRISNFRKTQVIFMPEAVSPAEVEDGDYDSPESVALHLPSGLIGSHPLSPTGQILANMEAQLRFAQATDALSGLRRSLAICAELSKYKATQVRGQRANTRARALLSTAHEKTAAYAARYRRARLAYLQLVGPGDWEDTLRVLNDGDVRTLATHQDKAAQTVKAGPREGYRTVSWIYMAPGNTEELGEGGQSEGLGFQHIY
jgi:hypothetical protein